MNYYEHHIGDYAQATSHLSFVEDAAYSRLIRKYYAEEKNFPADLKAVQRLIGARTKEEREAVANILDEFFTLESDGWHNKRCDAEIAKYQGKQVKARASAQARWDKRKPDAMRPHSENDANASTEPDANAMRTQCEGNAHQTPDTRHHTKAESTPTPAKPARFDPEAIDLPDGIDRRKWGEWIAYRRSRRLTTAEPTMRKQLEFLTQCQARGQPPDAVIEASIANGWQGLFELKGSGNGKNGSSRAERVSATIAELTGANRHPSPAIEGIAERVD